MQKETNTTISFIKTVMLLVVITAVFTVSKTQAQWVAQYTINATKRINNISAVDTNICWATVTNDLTTSGTTYSYYKTADGGQNWTSGLLTLVTTNSWISDIFALNADTAWLAVYNTNASKILKTTDGGTTWVHQTTAAFNLSGQYAYGIYFWDANNGFCYGEATAGYYEIYTTVNGGNNWVRTPSANIPPVPLSGESPTGYTVEGSNNIYMTTSNGRVYKSIDRGYNWSVTTTPASGLGAIAFADANNGMALTYDSTMIKTNDGGATWTFAPQNNLESSAFSAIYNIPGSGSTFFLTNDKGTAFSSNSGTNWSIEGSNILTQVDFVSSSAGWAANGTVIYKRTTPLSVATNDVLTKTIYIDNAITAATQTPIASFYNNGYASQSFNVTMEISGGYSSTKVISNLPYSGIQQVTFDPWTPTVGQYTVTVYTQLSSDSIISNDTLIDHVGVYGTFENYGWTDKPDLPNALYNQGCAFVLDSNTTNANGQLYSIGGYNYLNGGAKTAVNAFGTIANSWTSASPLPIPLFLFYAQRVGDNIYCAGGFTTNQSNSPSTFIYNISTDSWSAGADMPIPVRGYTSFVYKDSLIYYIGGNSSSGPVNSVQVYDPANDTWNVATDKPGVAVSALSSGIIKNKIIIVGGQNTQLGSITFSNAYMGEIDINDPTIINWTAILDYPEGAVSQMAGGTAYMGLRPLVVFAGGQGNANNFETMKSSCWAYDVDSGRWEKGPALSNPYANTNNFVGLVYNDSLWMSIAGGRTYANNLVEISKKVQWLNLGLAPALSLGITTIDDAVINSLVYPNPVINTAIIKFAVTHTDKVTVSLLDVTGRTITTLTDKTMTPGEQRLEWNAEKVNAGVYFIKIQIGDLSKLEKVVVTK